MINNQIKIYFKLTLILIEIPFKTNQIIDKFKFEFILRNIIPKITTYLTNFVLKK